GLARVARAGVVPATIKVRGVEAVEGSIPTPLPQPPPRSGEGALSPFPRREGGRGVRFWLADGGLESPPLVGVPWTGSPVGQGSYGGAGNHPRRRPRPPPRGQRISDRG